MSTERLGDVVRANGPTRSTMDRSTASDGVDEPARDAGPARTDGRQDEAAEFVRFCYRRRAVAWPELYDEMCMVAARGEYRGMSYEQLEVLGIGFALPSLPALATLVARVVAEERSSPHLSAVN